MLLDIISHLRVQQLAPIIFRDMLYIWTVMEIGILVAGLGSKDWGATFSEFDISSRCMILRCLNTTSGKGNIANWF